MAYLKRKSGNNSNKKWKKAISLLLCAALTASVTGCGNAEKAAAITDENEENVLEQVLDRQVKASHSSEAGKEETVYVMADARGTVNKVIVSDWVKNADGSTTLKDASNLKDIENVKGYEEYTAGNDGTLTWNADGADIYYQGTTDKELPVDVSLSYTLEGKEISPEELAGKSGRVTIRFDYVNKQTEKVTVGEKEEEIYVPFAMISGMVLPADTFSNIEVTNAKLISEGDNNLVVGVAFPGLKDSLHMEELKDKIEGEEKKQEFEEMDIPEYIEVAADAEDFSLNMTMTMAMSDVLSDVSLTDSIDLNDINSSMEDLEAASQELIEGTSDLKEGTVELRDGTGEMKDGTATLKDGTGTLLNGAVELKDGTGELKDGADNLKTGTSALKTGTGDLKTGADTLKAGTQELYQKSGELDAGVEKLDAGAAGLSAGSEKLSAGTTKLAAGSVALDDGAARLNGGLALASTGINTLINTFTGDGTAKNPGLINGSQALTEGMAGLDTLLNNYFAAYETDIDQVIQGLEEGKAAAAAREQVAQARLTQAQMVQSAAESALNAACEPSTETIQVEIGTENKNARVATVSGEIAGNDEKPAPGTADVQVEKISADKVKTAMEAYRKAGEEVAVCRTEVAQAKAEADAIGKVIQDLTAAYMTSAGMDKDKATKAAYITLIKNTSASLKTNSQKISEGISQIYGDGLLRLNDSKSGIPALAAGAAELKKGTETAVAGTKELNQGAKELNGGTLILKAGTEELKNGTGKLMEGTSALNGGAGTLQDGALKLDGGAKELDEGASKLKDGAAKLDEGAGKLSDGASELDNGAKDLKEGATKLDDGAVQLDEGAADLKDGMLRFDEEGISKLTELFGDNVQEILDRIDAVKYVGSNYNTFTELPEGTTGNVRFIYKTDAVKTE